MCPIFYGVIHQISRSHGLKNQRFESNFNKITSPVAAIKSRKTYICVSKYTIIVADNGLSSGRYQAIIWTNAGILWIRLKRTYFSEISFQIRKFSLKKCTRKCLRNGSHLSRPQCVNAGRICRDIWSLDPISGIDNNNLQPRFTNRE